MSLNQRGRPFSEVPSPSTSLGLGHMWPTSSAPPGLTCLKPSTGLQHVLYDDPSDDSSVESDVSTDSEDDTRQEKVCARRSLLLERQQKGEIVVFTVSPASTRSPSPNPTLEGSSANSNVEDENIEVFQNRSEASDGPPACGLCDGVGWSFGSRWHNMGACRPCAWFWQEVGCRSRENCEYCHLCGPGVFQERAAMRRATRAAQRGSYRRMCSAYGGAVGTRRPLPPGPVNGSTLQRPASVTLETAGWYSGPTRQHRNATI
mmetsp:Transcript_58936/g.140682  ORF Transcript_58936/g.140682 Transcript_58936/m.140682 type:complete len:261 (+) Transcript_58936:150-932(+)